MNKNIIIGVLVIIALAFALLYFNAPQQAEPVGGNAHFQTQSFIEGLYAGTSRQLSVSNAGLLTTTGGITNSGAFAQSGAIALSGAVTMSGTAHVSQSASSTLQIGNTDSGVNTGCLILGDSSGATSSPVYVTATGSSLSATTTKPAACR